MVKALPETEICGTWLAEELLDCTATLSSHGFLVRGLVSDNHPSNVKAFQIIKEKFPGDDDFLFHHLSSARKTYLFFDNVHLVKNIRNNLLGQKNLSFYHSLSTSSLKFYHHQVDMLLGVIFTG